MSALFLPTLGEDGRIVEGIATTLNVDGSVNISPMGPIVDREFSVLVFRPYQDSRTFQNLSRQRQGVFHVTDDVDLIAHAAVGEVTPLPRMTTASSIDGRILVDSCRWYEVEIESVDDSEERCTAVGRMVSSGSNRDFLGFNRAQAAVVEAAILATRTRLLPAEEILSSLEQLKSPVVKTGGSNEIAAFDFLYEHVCNQLLRSHSHT